jgi:hypothetical protein
LDGGSHETSAAEFNLRTEIVRGGRGTVAGVTFEVSDATLSPTELMALTVTP